MYHHFLHPEETLLVSHLNPITMSTNSNSPPPLGTLITLPPELRDRIYNHVLDMKYIVFWTYYHKERYPSSGGCTPTIPSDLSIRCASKALSAEASARLFDATVFTFDIGFSYFNDRLSPPPATAATGRMMNVEFRVITGAGMEELQNVQTELQRCWGPCAVRDVFDRFRRRPVWTLFKLRYAFELKFRPLEFREGDRKAGGL